MDHGGLGIFVKKRLCSVDPARLQRAIAVDELHVVERSVLQQPRQPLVAGARGGKGDRQIEIDNGGPGPRAASTEPSVEPEST
jgi:hypothetical protein